MSELPDRINWFTFDGDELVAVRIEDEGMAVSVRRVCAVLGLDSESQTNRLRAHAVLSEGLRTERIPLGNRVQMSLVILHKYVPFWLATISPEQVRPAVREKLIRYQRELVEVLAALYLPEGTSLQAQIAEMLQSVRLLLLAQGNQERRISAIEDMIGDVLPISPQQALYIQRCVQTISKRREQQTGSPIYDTLWATFKKHFNVQKYEALPAKHFDRAVAWLDEQARQFVPHDPTLPPYQEPLL